MVKKTLILLIVCLLILFTVAANPLLSSTEPPVPFHAVGVLTNIETGERIKIPLQTVTHQVGKDRYETEFTALIPLDESISNAQEISDVFMFNSSASYREDPTYSARVQAHMNYINIAHDGVNYYKIYNYQGKWERLDPAVTSPKLTVEASYLGEVKASRELTKNRETRTVLNPFNNTEYTNIPSWNTEYIGVYMWGGFHAGITKAWLQRGNTHWIFAVSISLEYK